MRAVATILVLTLGGCGPTARGSEDDDWMLGTFSRTGSLCGDTCVGGGQRLELSEGGQGTVVGVACEESTQPLSWVVQQDGSVKVDLQNNGRPTSIVFSRPRCDESGIVAHAAEWRFIDESGAEYVDDAVLYRSRPCPGEYIPGDDCEDSDGSECDPTGFCTLVWCERGEPERCDEEP